MILCILIMRRVEFRGNDISRPFFFEIGMSRSGFLVHFIYDSDTGSIWGIISKLISHNSMPYKYVKIIKRISCLIPVYSYTTLSLF